MGICFPALIKPFPAYSRAFSGACGRPSQKSHAGKKFFILISFLILFFMMALNLKNTWRIISMLDSWKKNELVNPGFNYGTEDDYHLRFFPPGELEIIRNAQNFDVKFEDYRPRSEFSYLKEGFLNLEEMRLTDKQLMAVSLVFYGGLKKSSLHES